MTLTYAQLKTAIQNYSEYEEETFDANLDLFIRLAEERILKNVQLTFFRKNATAPTVTNSQYLAMPSDYLAPMALTLQPSAGGERFFLDMKDLSFIQLYNPDPTNSGTPRYYAVFDDETFVLAPTPDATYTAQLQYLYRPASLTAGGPDGTTWLSENAEVALLYGSLVEGYTFMKGEGDMMQNYTQRFQDAINALKMHGEAREVSDEYRTGRVRRMKQ